VRTHGSRWRETNLLLAQAENGILRLLFDQLVFSLAEDGRSLVQQYQAGTAIIFPVATWGDGCSLSFPVGDGSFDRSPVVS
jgi:hypothetical protein